MAELILEHLNGHPKNVSQAYVRNDDETPIVDGWKKLKNDADNKITWNADALEVVCLTAMGCITASSDGRLSTKNLLDLLDHAINIQAGKSDDEPVGEGVDPPSMKRPGTDDIVALLSAIRSKTGSLDAQRDPVENW